MERFVTFVGAFVVLMANPLFAAGQSGQLSGQLRSPVLESDTALFMPLGDLPGGSASSAARGLAVFRFDESDESGEFDISVAAPAATNPSIDREALLDELGIEILVVGESSSADTGSNAGEAFLWTDEGGMDGLGSFAGGAFRSQAAAISLDGSAIVGASSSSSSGANALEAVLQDAEGVWELGDLAGGRFASEAYDVSLAGDYAVGASSSRYSGANSSEAFVWSEEDGMWGLGSLSGGQFRSAALGISDDGVVVVGWSSSSRSGANSSEAFVWSEEDGMRGLGSLSGGQFRSEARDLSFDGEVVVGAASSRRSGSNASEAFIWSEELGMRGLGFLSGGFADSEASAVTSDGETVVGSSKTPSRNDAFIWDEEDGMHSLSDMLEREGLDMRGWQLLSATDVASQNGAVVVSGTGLNPLQREEAWIAVISVPEPGVGAGWTAALLALLAWRRCAARRGRQLS